MVGGHRAFHGAPHILDGHRTLPRVPEKDLLRPARLQDIAARGERVRLLEHHRLYLGVTAEELHERPREFAPLRARAHADEQTVHHGGIAARGSRGQRDAVPLERAVLLDAPRVGLVRAVLGKGERAECYASHVEVPRRHLAPSVRCLEILQKAQRLLHARVGEIGRLAVRAKEPHAVGHRRLLPCVVIAAELVGHAVPVRILREGFRQCEKIRPRPVERGHCKSLAREQGLVDKHEGNHVLAGQRIAALLILPVPKRRAVVDLCRKVRVALHQRREVVQSATLGIEGEILRRQKKHIGLPALQKLSCQPLGIVLTLNAAHIAHANAWMRLLEFLYRAVDDGVRLALRHAPVAARKDADRQDGRAAPYEPRAEEHGDEEDEEQNADFPLHAHLISPLSSARDRSAPPKSQAVCGHAGSALRAPC